jgi:hypothetical protein
MKLKQIRNHTEHLRKGGAGCHQTMCIAETVVSDDPSFKASIRGETTDFAPCYMRLVIICLNRSLEIRMKGRVSLSLLHCTDSQGRRPIWPRKDQICEKQIKAAMANMQAKMFLKSCGLAISTRLVEETDGNQMLVSFLNRRALSWFPFRLALSGVSIRG